MGNDTNQKTSIVAESITNLTNSTTEVCSGVCNANTDNNVAVITNANGTKITYNTKCTTDAKCAISSSTQQAAAAQISAALQQQDQSITGIFQVVTNKVNQEQDISTAVVNNITQISQITCQASDTSSTSNNFVYVTNARNTKVAYNNEDSANANCHMRNLSKQQSTTKMSFKLSQKAKSEGTIAAIAIAMVSVLMIGGIIILLLFSAGALKGMTGGGGGGKNPTADPEAAEKAEDEMLKSEGLEGGDDDALLDETI
jgi:hypothetical protein